MSLVSQYRLSKTERQLLKKALKIEYLTLLYVFTVVVLMYIVMGSSQAMKSAWVEDILSLVPPVMFIFTHRFSTKPAIKAFPYGFQRVLILGFLVAALSLLVMAAYLIVDGVIKLMTLSHPTIGPKAFFGINLWLGWWALPVLLWASIPPVFLGKYKVKIATQLNDKILYTDAKMNKADWMTGLAAGVGLFGVGLGWWWADAVMALFISIDIAKDGLEQTKDALTALMDRAPTELDNGYNDLAQTAVKALETLPWVKRATVRLREEGRLYFGEGFCYLREGQAVTPATLEEAVQKVKALDWRIHDLVITVVNAAEN